jgi:hypothetical protein
MSNAGDLAPGHIVARTGDGQLATLLLRPLDKARACDLAEPLRQRLSPVRADQHAVTVGVAIGCARHLQHGADGSGLRQADRAMFERYRHAMH